MVIDYLLLTNRDDPLSGIMVGDHPTVSPRENTRYMKKENDAIFWVLRIPTKLSFCHWHPGRGSISLYLNSYYVI